MNWDRLVRVAGPAAPVLDTDAGKAHLREVDDDRADEIDDLIDAATAMVEGPFGVGIALLEQTWKMTLDGFPCARVPIPLGPVREVVSIVYVAADGTVTTLAADQYALAKDQDPAIVAPAYGLTWPTPRCEPGAVRITFKAGFGTTADDVPQDLRSAVKLILSSLYDGDGSMPPAARAILNRYGVIAPA